MKGNKLRRRSGTLKINIISNVLLAFLILMIATFSTFSTKETKKTGGMEADIYRNGKSTSLGVSLMFNVYWGTEEVYRILEILKEFDAKATFFIGGCWADDNAQCLRDIYIAGHEIGNHGYFHKDHSKFNFEENQKEINACNQFIQRAIGIKPVLFAPPSGAYNDDMVTAATSLGLFTVLWSKDTIDWRDKNAAIIYSRATNNVKNGDFILMHPMKETADALHDILKFYQNHGLKSVTVSQNLQKEG